MKTRKTRNQRTTDAIEGLNETNLMLGAVGIVAGFAAFFTGGTSLAAYAAFASGILGSIGGVASGSLQVHQGKTTGDKKESREGWESIGFGIGGIASTGLGVFASSYENVGRGLRSAIRGASSSLDVGMMAIGTVLTIKSDATGNGGIGLKKSDWQGDLALTESILGIGMFGMHSYNSYNEYKICFKANQGVRKPLLGVQETSESEIYRRANSSKMNLDRMNIPQKTREQMFPETDTISDNNLYSNFRKAVAYGKKESQNSFDASQLKVIDYAVLGTENPRIVIHVSYKEQEFYFYRSSGGAGKQYVGDGYYVTGGSTFGGHLIKITQDETNSQLDFYENQLRNGENTDAEDRYYRMQVDKHADLLMANQGGIKLFQSIARYLYDRY